MIRVHIAHDHQVLREAIADIIGSEPDIEILELTPEGLEGLAHVDQRTDVLVVGVPWDQEVTLWLRRYREALPDAKIVALFMDPSNHDPLIAAGANAAVDVADGSRAVVEAIRAVVGDRDRVDCEERLR